MAGRVRRRAPLRHSRRPGASQRHSQMANLACYPGLALPNGFAASGAPTSVLFMAQPYGEAKLLAVAKAYQDATGFHLAQPPEFAVGWEGECDVIATGVRVGWVRVRCCVSPSAAMAAGAGFRVEEATIASIQAAIKSGRTTCRQVVEAYVQRARAYNGVCTALVTRDGGPIPLAKGYRRAGAPLVFPTKTVKASTVLPDLDRYEGSPLDYGRMEATVSDPSVMAQMGMRVGIPDAGQLNALETLNLRGERSVTCKGTFDAPPASRPLPPGAPAPCEKFRQQPDALEQAAALDAKYGTTPDLDALPMYCVVTAVKDPYDTKDMRTTANNDVNFAMDVPPFDSTVVARLRAKGAIIYAKSVAHEFNGGPGNPGGPTKAKTKLVSGGQGMGSWGGQPCNPYDTTRVPRGSSSGSGVAVSANLVTVGICEQSGASCQGPASRSGITTLLTTKGLLPDSGGIGYQWFNDRVGIHARTLADAAAVLDAMKDPVDGLLRPSRSVHRDSGGARVGEAVCLLSRWMTPRSVAIRSR